MAKPNSKCKLDLSPENWPKLVHLHKAERVTPDQKYEYHRDPWPDRGLNWEVYEGPYVGMVNRIAPVLIDTGFFEVTPYKSLAIFAELTSPWERNTDPTFIVSKSDLIGSRRIHFEDFGHMSFDEFLNFQFGVAAEVLLAICARFGLKSDGVRALRDQYPIPKIEMSSIKFEPSETLIDPSPDLLDVPITDRELVFPAYDSFKWCVYPPYTDRMLAEIGRDTRTVRVPVGSLVDDYVRIANAMLRAPTAQLRVEGSGWWEYLDSDLEFLKYFRHLRRVCLATGQFQNLEELSQLSPDLIALELDLRYPQQKPSLASLQHFRSLQSLTLVGHYEDLSQFEHLESLRALRLSEVNIKNLSSLTSLNRLQSLMVDTSNVQDLSDLPSIGQLQYLCLIALPKLMNVDPVKDLPSLEFLEIRSLTKLESLPTLSQLSRLRRVDLGNLKRLDNLRAISDAPNLEFICISEMRQLQASQLECLRAHLTLKDFTTDDVALEKALGLPRLREHQDFTFSPFTPPPKRSLPKEVNVVKPSIKESPSLPRQANKHLGERWEELRIHLQLHSNFGDDQEFEKCNAVEERIGELISTDLLGRWDGQEVGMGLYSIYMVGPSAMAMYDAVKAELELVAPDGSFVELEDCDGNLISKISIAEIRSN